MPKTGNIAEYVSRLDFFAAVAALPPIAVLALVFAVPEHVSEGDSTEQVEALARLAKAVPGGGRCNTAARLRVVPHCHDRVGGDPPRVVGSASTPKRSRAPGPCAGGGNVAFQTWTRSSDY